MKASSGEKTKQMITMYVVYLSGDLKAYHILDGEEEYVISNPWPTSQNFYDTNFHHIAPKELGLWK